MAEVAFRYCYAVDRVRNFLLCLDAGVAGTGTGHPGHLDGVGQYDGQSGRQKWPAAGPLSQGQHHPVSTLDTGWTFIL
jgi:hypothetical protein